MRRSFGLLLLPLFSLPAFAADPPKATHLTWEQRFEQANLAHDGHLTLEQANGGFPLVAKHFNDIDVDHKGYVTENNIRAWRAMRKASHRLGQPVNDRIKPQNAMQLAPVQHKPLNTVTTQTVPVGSAAKGDVETKE